jgi:hypothetical protein
LTGQGGGIPSQSTTSQSQESIEWPETQHSSLETSVPSIFAVNASSTLLAASEAVPLLSRLSLGSNASQPPSQTATSKKRTQQTKEQMCVYREEQERIKRLKAAEKEAAKARLSSAISLRGRCRARSQNSQSQPTTSSQSRSQSTTVSAVTDSNPAFILKDYQNICTYLEDLKNYQQLYGSGLKTSIGLSPVSKAAAYDIFAIFINDCSSQGLCLTGKQLRSRIDTYRKKFAHTKNWAENTGAGIEEQDGEAVLAEKLERMCPCYERMYNILGHKHNITPLELHDSMDGVGAMVSSASDNSDDSDRSDDETECPNNATGEPDNATARPDEDTQRGSSPDELSQSRSAQNPLTQSQTSPNPSVDCDLVMDNLVLSQESQHKAGKVPLLVVIFRL